MTRKAQHRPLDTSREDSLRKLAGFAIMVALDAPEKLSKRSCYISSNLVAEIRKALEEHGYDWRKHKAEQEAAAKAAWEQGKTARLEAQARATAEHDAQVNERQLCNCGQMSHHKIDCAVMVKRIADSRAKTL